MRASRAVKGCEMPCLERGSGTNLIAVASARRDVDVAVADKRTKKPFDVGLTYDSSRNW